MKYQKSKYLFPILLLLLAVISATTLSFAAYTSRNYKKGVIQAAQSQPLFTSDKLSAADGKTEYIYVSKDQTTAIAAFTLYNYPVGSPELFCKEDIGYTLTFSGADAQTQSGILSGGSDDQESYTVSFPKDSSLTVTATPTNPAIAHTGAISCTFIAVESSSQTAITSGVTGTFMDRDAEAADCQAFHYRVSLLAYSGTVTLKTDSTALRLLPATTEGSLNGNTWTYTASTSETKDFEFVFYRTETEPESLTWEAIEEAVTLEP